jgi:hypothetical protein
MHAKVTRVSIAGATATVVGDFARPTQGRDHAILVMSCVSISDDKCTHACAERLSVRLIPRNARLMAKVSQRERLLK